MAKWLKRGMDASAIKAADAKVRQTVEDILAQVEERKDDAIRALTKAKALLPESRHALIDQVLGRAATLSR